MKQNKVILFDNIEGTLYEGYESAINELLLDLKNEYKDNHYIAVGRENINDVNAWFIRDLEDNFSHIDFIDRVESYLAHE